LKSAFRKISRVGSLTGGTKWYLSEDCLLAAKRVMYAVEYRRFYLRDVESIVVWPTRAWLWRVAVEVVLFAGISLLFWQWSSTTGAIFLGIGLALAAWELALGPTAGARICTTGSSVDLPLVARTRRARKVLATIDTGIRSVRGVTEQPAAPISNIEPAQLSPQMPAQTNFEVTPGVPVADAPQTNGS
jgi:hypothetical protein